MAPTMRVSLDTPKMRASVTSAPSRQERSVEQVVTLEQVGGGAVEPHLTLLHEHGPVGEPQRLVHGLLDEDDRDPLFLQPFHCVQELLHDQRRQSERELVDQEELRIEQEPTR